MNATEQWNAFVCIVVKEIRRFMRIWGQTLLPPAITMVLYFVIFGSLIGSRIGQMGGYDYIQFVAPGLIMMSVITSSYANVVSSFFGSKFQKNIEEMLVSPMPNFIILLGFMSGGVVRGLLVGVFVTLVSLFFTDLNIHLLSVTLLVAFLTAVLFSLAGIVNGIFAKKFDDISIVPTFVLTPLTYLGGIFYSIDLLSPFWQKIIHINPIFYMVNAFRYGMLGKSDIDIMEALVVIISFIVLLYILSLTLIRKGVGIRS